MREGAAVEIPLTLGKVALVDAADLPLVGNIKWRAGDSKGKIYAVHGRHQKLRMHRLIIGAPKGVPVDHANGDTLDNRRCNLRLCTPSQNGANSVTPRGSSQYRGVRLRRKTGRWIAQINVQNKRIHIGVFPTEREAALAWDAVAHKAFGEFARLNFPGGA